jgi:phosphatidylinositol alpha-mannosyltransferase
VRVALIAEDYYPQLGGIPEHVHNLALQLTARGHLVTVVSSHMSGEDAEASRYPYAVRRIGTSVVIYANGGVSRVTVGRRLRRRLEELLREGAFDLAHVHGGLAPTFGALMPLVTARVGIPLVATFHSWFPRSVCYRLFRRQFRRLLNLHAANIAVSQPVADAHARYWTASWEIIPNGVDVEYFHPDGRQFSAPPAAGPRLLYMHRLEPRNHLETLLAAMPAILARYPDATLTVAGHGPWGRYYAWRSRSLGSSVRFLGRVEGRPEHYRRADLYLCPTMRAGFGITLLEAMACGTPMIVADNVGFRTVVDEGREALVVPHNAPAAWAEATIGLMDDPAHREAMSHAGRAKALRYAWPLVTQRILEVYERVLRRGAR